MLVAITNREMFDHGMGVVLARWRRLCEDDFADWLEKVYLDKKWGEGSFNAGAGGFPGVYLLVCLSVCICILTVFMYRHVPSQQL
jgi:hypothetical protein